MCDAKTRGAALVDAYQIGFETGQRDTAEKIAEGIETVSFLEYERSGLERAARIARSYAE